jgi:hypothetical protein
VVVSADLMLVLQVFQRAASQSSSVSRCGTVSLLKHQLQRHSPTFCVNISLPALCCVVCAVVHAECQWW